MARLFDMEIQTPTPGSALRILRKLSGKTLKEVSDGAGVSVAYLSKVERNEEVPTATYVGIVTGFLAAAIVAGGQK